jgi:hypothetical protein
MSIGNRASRRASLLTCSTDKQDGDGLSAYLANTLHKFNEILFIAKKQTAGVLYGFDE